MKIAIGLPATIPGVKGERLIEWAKRVDQGLFSSLAIIDRIVYSNYEPMITLAVAAGATKRVRLMTAVILGPTRNAVLLAKEAASLDALSGGRFTLGLGVGGREEDFKAVGVSFKGRGRILDEQIATMRRVWSGQEFGDGVGSIGPAPVQKGGPEILIGGYAPSVLRRAGRLADGFMPAHSTPEAILKSYAVVEQAWREAGKPGRPRLVGSLHCALGPKAQERIDKNLRGYYSFAGDRVERIVKEALTTPQGVRDYIRSMEETGMDELICWPWSPDMDQLERLQDLI